MMTWRIFLAVWLTAIMTNGMFFGPKTILTMRKTSIDPLWIDVLGALIGIVCVSFLFAVAVWGVVWTWEWAV